VSRDDPPLWAVVGSTGTGKSRLAMEVAERAGGEIISVDSAQVFLGLDIGTAKPTRPERARVPHHLIDVIEPDDQWTSAGFADAADVAIAKVRSRGKIPVLCGGTGLWLRALTRGLFEAPPISEAIRDAVRAELEHHGSPAVPARLAKLDPVAAARLHPNDSQRIGRALEFVRETGVPISHAQAEHGFRGVRHRWIGVGLEWPRDRLIARLAERTRAMFAAGLVEEVTALRDNGLADDSPGLGCIGYRETVRHLKGELTRDEAIEAIDIATRQYAKRQKNWFNHDTEVTWLPPDASADDALALFKAVQARTSSVTPP